MLHVIDEIEISGYVENYSFIYFSVKPEKMVQLSFVQNNKTETQS